MNFEESSSIIPSEYIARDPEKFYIPSSILQDALKRQEQARKRLRQKELLNEGKKIEIAQVELENIAIEMNVVKKQANEERKLIIEAAEEEKKKIIDISKEEREKILEEARIEKEKIIQEGLDKQEEIKKQAYKEGFDAGFLKAYQDGRVEREKIIIVLKQVLDAALEKRIEIIDTSRKHLLQVIMAITKKIIFHETKINKELIQETISNAIKEIRGKESIVIRIHPADLEITQKHIEDFIAEARGLREIEIKIDSGISRGGCLIETDFGKIDARIESQCDVFFNKLSKVLINIDALPVSPEENNEEGKET